MSIKERLEELEALVTSEDKNREAERAVARAVLGAMTERELHALAREIEAGEDGPACARYREIEASIVGGKRQ